MTLRALFRSTGHTARRRDPSALARGELFQTHQCQTPSRPPHGSSAGLSFPRASRRGAGLYGTVSAATPPAAAEPGDGDLCWMRVRTVSAASPVLASAASPEPPGKDAAVSSSAQINIQREKH